LCVCVCVLDVPMQLRAKVIAKLYEKGSTLVRVAAVLHGRCPSNDLHVQGWLQARRRGRGVAVWLGFVAVEWGRLHLVPTTQAAAGTRGAPPQSKP
jgi:hypothetical protein